MAAVGRAVSLSPLAGGRSSPLGLAYLRCAERGELPGPAEALLRAIAAGDVPAANRRARRLRSWGASSGAPLFWGMAAAGPSVARTSLGGGSGTGRVSAAPPPRTTLAPASPP